MKRNRADSAIAAYPLYQEGDGGSLPTSALDFHFDEIDMRTARELNSFWHSLLPRTDLGNLLCGNTSVAFGAYFENRYFAVGIWSQPIIAALCDGATIELRRLALCKQCPKNTASRMLAIMRNLIKSKFPKTRRLISYQAVDIHEGTIYKAAGWSPVGKIVNARPQRLPGSPQRATGPLQTTSRKRRWELIIGENDK